MRVEITAKKPAIPDTVAPIMTTASACMRRMTLRITVMLDTFTTSLAATIIVITTIMITTVILMFMTTNKPEDFLPLTELSWALSTSEGAALYRLMTWLSPSFPVGAFSYSSGIEWAVEAGDIKDAHSLQDWLAAMLANGSGFCDGVFLAQIHRAAISGDLAGLCGIAELAAAFAPSRERHLKHRHRAALSSTSRGPRGAQWSGQHDCGLRRPGRLSCCRRNCQCRARDPACTDDACISARGDVELDFRGRKADPFGSDRQPTHLGGPRAYRRHNRASGHARNARRARQRNFSGRCGQHASRDAIYAAIQIMNCSSFFMQLFYCSNRRGLL